jgi:histidinol-phosphate aminotransferase
MKLVEDFIVPWVRESAPYSAKHMDFAWQNPDLLRMMSNENLLPPSQKVLEAIAEAARLGNLYPDSGPKLRRRLGEKAGLSEENVVLGNGSTDVINFVIHTFVAPGDELVISVPTFSMYESRARIAGGVPILVPMRPDLYWDLAAIINAACDKTKLIFICSPNNPTGNQITEQDLRRILELGIPTFFDEAYFELENEPFTRAYLIREYPHLMVNRTLSKAYGLAGLRVGYLLCAENLANYFNRVKIPWNVSLVALAAALAGLEDEQDARTKRENIIQGRDFVRDAINHMPGLRAFPSEGNFVLIDASILGKTSPEIVDDLIARGIYIRPMGGHHMPQGFVRVTIGTPEQNRFFLETFRAYIREVQDKKARLSPAD